MDSMLEAFLAGRTPFAFDTATWGTLDLEIRYYASDELVVLMGCSELSGSADWVAGLNSKYRTLIGFMLEESAGGFLYALLLVVFTNGVSYLPALVLARIFGTEPKS